MEDFGESTRPARRYGGRNTEGTVGFRDSEPRAVTGNGVARRKASPAFGDREPWRGRPVPARVYGPSARRRAPGRFAGLSTRKAPPGFGGPEARGPAFVPGVGDGRRPRVRRCDACRRDGDRPETVGTERGVAAAADGDFAESPVDQAIERRHRREDDEAAGEVPAGALAARGRSRRAPALRRNRSAEDILIPVFGFRSPVVGGGESGRALRRYRGETRPPGRERAPRGGRPVRLPAAGGPSASCSSAPCPSRAPRRGPTWNRRNGRGSGGRR